MTRALEELADLIAELLDEVTTSEKIAGHRRVTRGRRQLAVAETLIHRTIEPGLLDQLQAVASRPTRRLERHAITTIQEVDGNRQRIQLRAGVVDERGQPLLRAAWDEHSRRTVQEPVTVPLTKVTRAAPGPAASAAAAGIARPGAAVPGGSPGWDRDGALAPTGRGSPGSRPPATDALDVLLDINAAARRLYGRMLRAAQEAGHIRDARARHGLSAILRHLVSLAAVVDDGTAAHALQAVRGWVKTARTVIGYEAPILHLKDICCWDPNCAGRLAVRADGSTPLWCTAWRLEAGPAAQGDPWPRIAPCPIQYRRHEWLDLFQPGGTEPVQAAPRRRLPHSIQIEGHGGRS